MSRGFYVPCAPFLYLDLQQRLDKAVTSQSDFVLQLEKVKDENDDLRFQLEEKSIELEGTKAQVRVLERLHLKNATPPSASQDEVHLSITESAQDLSSSNSHSEAPTSPRKRPSKIPLGTKSYVAPKPPTGKTAKGRDNSTSLSGKNSVGKNSSLFQKNSLNSGTVKSRDSLNSAKRNDSLSGKKSCESLSTGRMNSIASNVSGGKRDSLSSKKDSSFSSTGGRKSLHRQLSTRRSHGGNSTVIDPGDSAHSKKTSQRLVEHVITECKKRQSSPDSLDFTPRVPVYKFPLDPTPPWNNSSSSEYFDSINISENALMDSGGMLNGSASVFNNMQQLHSCSDSREEYFDSSTKHEGMADYDSLELASQVVGNKLILSRNVWVTAESNDADT